MNESLPSPELINGITREEVVGAYRKFVEQGIKHPGDLDFEDPEVQEADELSYKWQKQEDELAKGNEELQLRVNLSKTMLHVDAGFTDPDYLEEVLKYYFGAQDAPDAEKQPDNPERVETRRQIARAMGKVKKLLAGQN